MVHEFQRNQTVQFAKSVCLTIIYIYIAQMNDVIEWTLDNPIETSIVKPFLSESGEKMVCIKKTFTSMDGKPTREEESIIQTAASYECDRQKGIILWGVAISKNEQGDLIKQEFDDSDQFNKILGNQTQH